jgi:hypothetical protein
MKRQSNLIQPIGSKSYGYMKKLESIIKQSFDIDTCYPGERKDWTKQNPTIGQCAITALVVQDYLGGEIAYDQNNIHFWNRIDGKDIDFTREQFDTNIIIQMTRIRTRQDILEGPRAEAAETLTRYNLLSSRIKFFLTRDGTTKSNY